MLKEHALRRSVVGEMHLRRWPPVHAPATIVQLVNLVAEGERENEFAAVNALAATADGSGSPRHFAAVLSDELQFLWEKHSEASSLTIIADRSVAPADDLEFARAIDVAEAMPGEVIRATRIVIVKTEADAFDLLPAMDFLESDLVTCHVAGNARIWSDFRIKDDGYGCMLISVGDMLPNDVARMTQRLQELGNYRNLALLGLPMAQNHWRHLDLAEAKLQSLGEDVTSADISEEDLMERLSQLSLELISIATSTNYRMSASTAYARLVDERLSDLAPQKIEGYPSLVDFTQRRFYPAMRTCSSFTEREQQISARSAQLTSLLRTRIEAKIEAQNVELLQSMERSTTMQLRLQHLVEGLSVVAISYYVIGLSHYILKGLEAVSPAVSATVIASIATPPTLLIIWLILKRMKRRLLTD